MSGLISRAHSSYRYDADKPDTSRPCLEAGAASRAWLRHDNMIARHADATTRSHARRAQFPSHTTISRATLISGSRASCWRGDIARHSKGRKDDVCCVIGSGISAPEHRFGQEARYLFHILLAALDFGRLSSNKRAFEKCFSSVSTNAERGHVYRNTRTRAAPDEYHGHAFLTGEAFSTSYYRAHVAEYRKCRAKAGRPFVPAMLPRQPVAFHHASVLATIFAEMAFGTDDFAPPCGDFVASELSRQH